MGFGHRVYKNGDPRNGIIKVSALIILKVLNFYLYIEILLIVIKTSILKSTRCITLALCYFRAY